HSIFRDGLDGFKNFFDRVYDLFLKLIADMLAAKMMQKVAAAVAGMMGNAAPAGAQVPGGAMGLTNDQLAMGGAAVGGAMVGYGLGGSIYNATGSKTMGALGGAAGGAALGTAILPGIGTAIGALAGLAGGILGVGQASAEAARQLAEARRSTQLSLEMMRAERAGDGIEMRVIQEKAKFEALRKQVEDAYGGKKAEKERERYLDEINREERRRIELLREGSDVLHDFNGQVLNLGRGFVLERAVFEAMERRSSYPGTPPAPDSPPRTTPSPGGETPQSRGDANITLQVDGQTLGRVVVGNLQQMAADTFGDSTRWPELLVTGR
ncbi:MAG: hypothetical protein H0X64_13755, partial [Gemmatimonadaceae bacterium]|nr:hypothetical protein [Gemmatimonadaceae bacterium]